MKEKLLKKICAISLSSAMLCAAGQTVAVSVPVSAESDIAAQTDTASLTCTAVSSAGFMTTGGSVHIYCSADGGSGNITFAVYSRLSGTEEWTTIQDFSENSTAEFSAAQEGKYEIKVVAADASGNTDEKILEVTAFNAFTNASELSSEVSVLGNAVTIKGKASGGSAPFKYSAYYRIAGNKSWKVISEDSDEPDISFEPKGTENYEIKSSIKDSAGRTQEKEMQLKVISQLKNLSTFSAVSIPEKGSVNISCSAKGGLGKLQYAVSYRIYGSKSWEMLQDYSENKTVVFTPGIAGVFEVRVSVMDEMQTVVDKNTKITAADTLVNNSKLSADTVILGKSVTINSAAAGGIAPYTYAAFYRLKGNENWIKLQDYSSESAVAFTPKGSGTYELRSTIKDSAGKTSRKEFTVQSAAELKNISTVSASSVALNKEADIKCASKGGFGKIKYAVYSRLSSENDWTVIQELSENKTAKFLTSVPGIYYIKVDAVDETGKTVSKQIKITAADTLTNSVSLSSDTLISGKKAIIDISASGGIAPYTYAAFYRLKGNTNWIKISDYTSNSSIGFTPKTAGTYELRCNTKDSSGKAVRTEMDINVIAPLKNTSLRSASSVIVGKSMDINCSAKGGQGSYTFAVYSKLSGSDDNVLIQDFSENKTVKFAPEKSGNYEITVIAKDELQNTAEKKITVTAFDDLKNNIELSDNTTVTGGSITINCQGTGGTAPYTYAAFYRLKGNENWIRIRSYSENSVFEFVPKSKGTYELRLNAKDSDGKAARTETEVEVVPTLKNISSLSSGAVIIGKSIEINCEATGGIGELEYRVTASLAGSGEVQVIKEYSAEKYVSFDPDVPGTYEITVTARDTKNNKISKKLQFVAAEPVQNTSTISSGVIMTGETVTINCSSTDGIEPCRYAVYYRKQGSEKWATAQSYKAETTVVLTPASAAVYEIKTSVKDAGGYIDDKIMTVRVLKPLANNSYLSSESIVEGRRVKICCSASGGSGTFHYAVSYKDQEASEWNEICGSENTASVYFTPPAPGIYDIRVDLSDDNDTIVSKDLVLEVVSKEETKVTLKWNGHTYKLINNALSPEEAENFCEEAGGYLVSITSEEEQKAIAGFISYLPKNTLVTIGAFDFGHEGTWEWFSGEKFLYSNWADGEPDNGSGWGQDYSAMDSTTGLWYDYFGGWDGETDIKAYFICELNS